MVLNPPIERLHLALIALVALDRQIQRTIADHHGSVSAHPAARDLLAGIEEISRTHLDALFERIHLP